MSRLGPIAPEDMSDEQRVVFDGITGGDRQKGGDPSEFLNDDGALRGPFNAMLRSPELGDITQEMGACVRYRTIIPGPLRELAILVCGRHWRANYEWYAHAKIARREGLSDDVINGIMDEQEPLDPDHKTVYQFAYKLNKTGRIDDELYARTHDLLGERGVFELTVLIGYYATVSNILNVFQVPIPEGESLPFPD
jgi:4-carboxymuconolactone decarboxylase